MIVNKNRFMHKNGKRFKSIGRYLRFWQAVASSGLPMDMVIREKPYQLMVALIALYTAIPVVTIVPGTYVRPHRHPHTFELLLPLRGRFVVLNFDDRGTVT
ncbi:WbuC family cupin fold metalloprotein, partial [Enterobacter kobei]|uniref:WbuC family cupin fold metalloprotein n=1 Tax=Enterobacter kobei TaxID=208224 RepID=UPI001FD04579